MPETPGDFLSSMNVHHLELFYYVARFGGITQAVRRMPYGIQQPAVSSQILQLEDQLGVILFQRRPFELTPAGQELYAFVEPFFSRLSEVQEKLSGGDSQRVRIAASSIVLREHLPGLLQQIRAGFPELRVALQSRHPSEMFAALEKQEVDLVLTSVEGKPPAGCDYAPLLEIPLVLLVPRKCPLTSVQALWEKDRISEGLVGLPPSEVISKQFQAGLQKRGVQWPVSIEVDSLDVLEAYVLAGFGFGVSAQIPGRKWPRELRVLPLGGFTPLQLAIFWRGKLNALQRQVVEVCAQRAEALRQHALPPKER